MVYNAEQEVIAADVITQIDSEYYRQINDYDSLRRILCDPTISGSDSVRIKALIVMLYSHYEGFVKFSSMKYVDLVNRLNLNTSVVQAQFAAGSLDSLFKDIEQNRAKCDFFRNSLPDDTKLHQLYRRCHLVEHLHELWNNKIDIETTYIDTDSNLKYYILSRILYSIGLDPKLMDPYQAEIERLLRFRNPLAHGDILPDSTYVNQFPRIENATLNLIAEYRRIIHQAIITKKFLKEIA